MKLLTAMVCACLVAGCAAGVGLKAPGIASVIDDYAAAWLAGKPDRVMALLTDDAVLMPHHGDPPVAGRDAIRAHWWPDGATAFTVTAFEFRPMEISVDRKTGYAHGRFSLSFEFQQDGETVRVSNRGNFMMVFRRDAAGWRIARYIWNDPVARAD